MPSAVKVDTENESELRHLRWFVWRILYGWLAGAISQNPISVTQKWKMMEDRIILNRRLPNDQLLWRGWVQQNAATDHRGHLCLATLLQSNISPMQTDLVQLNQVILNLAVINRDAMPKVAV
jgi:hypothetical protein